MLEAWEFGDSFGRESNWLWAREVRAKRSEHMETDFSSTWRTLGPVSIQSGAWLAPKENFQHRKHSGWGGSLMPCQDSWRTQSWVGWDTGLDKRFNFLFDAMIPWFCTVCVFSQENGSGKANSSGLHVGRQKFPSWPPHQWRLSKSSISLTFAYSSANHLLSFHSDLAYHPTSLCMLWAFILVISSTW